MHSKLLRHDTITAVLFAWTKYCPIDFDTNTLPWQTHHIVTVELKKVLTLDLGQKICMLGSGRYKNIWYLFPAYQCWTCHSPKRNSRQDCRHERCLHQVSTRSTTRAMMPSRIATSFVSCFTVRHYSCCAVHNSVSKVERSIGSHTGGVWLYRWQNNNTECNSIRLYLEWGLYPSQPLGNRIVLKLQSPLIILDPGMHGKPTSGSMICHICLINSTALSTSASATNFDSVVERVAHFWIRDNQDTHPLPYITTPPETDAAVYQLTH